MEENIRFIGAGFTYRTRKPTAGEYDLTREDNKKDELIYKVEQLSQSLLYYIFYFCTIKDEDEKNI